MISSLLNSTIPEVEPPPPDDSESASRCHLLGTTGLVVQFISTSIWDGKTVEMLDRNTQIIGLLNEEVVV